MLEDLTKKLRIENVHIEKENANIKAKLNEKQLEIEGKSSNLLRLINAKEIERNALIQRHEDVSKEFEDEKMSYEIMANKAATIMDVFIHTEEYIQIIDKLIFKISEQVNVEKADIDEESLRKEKERHLRDLNTLNNLLPQLMSNEDALLKQKEELEKSLKELQ